jgi:hypothetical protein
MGSSIFTPLCIGKAAATARLGGIKKGVAATLFRRRQV